MPEQLPNLLALPTARAGAAFLTGAALALLATACSPAYALPNQPQSHVQKAQAATQTVADAPTH